jgi:AbrB family looped-hinge helix DNA binding protein
MSKVTSKLQLTVPKAIADQYGIRPGDELQWRAAGEAIHVIPAKQGHWAEQARTIEERLELFDQATRRQRLRQRKARKAPPGVSGRGWKREELYGRPLND